MTKPVSSIPAGPAADERTRERLDGFPHDPASRAAPPADLTAERPPAPSSIPEPPADLTKPAPAPPTRAQRRALEVVACQGEMNEVLERWDCALVAQRVESAAPDGTPRIAFRIDVVPR